MATECLFCHRLYDRIQQHYAVSTSCRPQYQTYVKQQNNRTAPVILEKPPDNEIGLIGENRPLYIFNDDEEESRSVEADDATDRGDFDMQIDDETLRRDTTAGTQECRTSFNTV